MSERKHEMEIEIDAPVDLVWKAITEGKELTRWFAPEVEVQPGLGGHIKLGWGPGMEGTAPITVWEPGHRVAWTEDHGNGRVKVVEFVVEGQGGKTRLRLVHSGFGIDASFDAEYEATHGGWSVFLTMLRFGLEHHAVEPATHVWKFHIVPMPQPELAARLTGLFDTEPVEGAPFQLSWGGGTITGTVLRIPRPGYVCLAVDQWNRSLLGLFVEKMGGQTAVTVQTILFGPGRSYSESAPAGIEDFFARLLPAASA